MIFENFRSRTGVGVEFVRIEVQSESNLIDSAHLWCPMSLCIELTSPFKMHVLVSSLHTAPTHLWIVSARDEHGRIRSRIGADSDFDLFWPVSFGAG